VGRTPSQAGALDLIQKLACLYERVCAKTSATFSGLLDPLHERARAAAAARTVAGDEPEAARTDVCHSRARPASLRLRARGEREREHRAESQNPS